MGIRTTTTKAKMTEQATKKNDLEQQKSYKNTTTKKGR